VVSSLFFHHADYWLIKRNKWIQYDDLTNSWSPIIRTATTAGSPQIVAKPELAEVTVEEFDNWVVEMTEDVHEPGWTVVTVYVALTEIEARDKDSDFLPSVAKG